MTIEDRLGALVQQLTTSGGSCKELSVNSGDVSGCSSFNLQLCELVQVTTKVTQLDSICAQAAEATPAKNAEAKKWQELSINAIQLSREALVEQQKRCVQKLTELCELPTPSSMPGGKATQPRTAITPTASYTHSQKFMGPGGYMEPVEARGPAAPVGGCISQKPPGSVSNAAVTAKNSKWKSVVGMELFVRTFPRSRMKTPCASSSCGASTGWVLNLTKHLRSTSQSWVMFGMFLWRIRVSNPLQSDLLHE